MLLPQDFEVTPISTLSLRRAKAGNEERSSYVPKVATAKGRFEAPIGLNSHQNDGKTFEKIVAYFKRYRVSTIKRLTELVDMKVFFMIVLVN